jgi:hypothetical protein
MQVPPPDITHTCIEIQVFTTRNIECSTKSLYNQRVVKKKEGSMEEENLPAF